MSASALSIVKPIGLTDATLIDTDVPEADYSVWSSSVTYASAARVIRNNLIWESLQASNVDKVPGAEPLWWVEVSATNRWKAFDLSNSSQTVQAGAIYYEIKPGVAVNAVAALNLSNASSMRLRLNDPSFGLVYDKTFSLTTIPSESSWYAWFFGERTESAQVFTTDLPSYPNATLQINLVGGASLAVGVLLFGQLKSVGIGVIKGAKIGIQDYSRKERNDFGDVVLVRRAFAKRANFAMVLLNSELDNTQQLLTDIRATPALFIGSGKYVSTQIFGFYNAFDINISYAEHSECTLDIEGLT